MTTGTAKPLAQRLRPLAAGAPVVAAHFVGRNAALALGEAAVVLVAAAGETRRVAVHAGAILATAGDGARLIAGGDDGRVAEIAETGAVRTLAQDAARRWIDQVAVAPDGSVAWSAGKSASVLTRKGETRSVDLPSSAGGLAFAPKGFRLAVAHYNGVSLWFPNAQAKPEFLEWKGSHLGVTFSPDGKFLVTTMQEPMLHGWRLADGKHMRMSGYAGRVRSLAWTADGDFLATSGADRLILWDFRGRDGPMGKEPRMRAPYSARLAAVACHPAQDVVACGFADGLILFVRLSDSAEIMVRKPAGAPAAALAFSADGTLFAFGCEDGEAGVVDLS